MAVKKVVYILCFCKMLSFSRDSTVAFFSIDNRQSTFDNRTLLSETFPTYSVLKYIIMELFVLARRWLFAALCSIGVLVSLSGCGNSEGEGQPPEFAVNVIVVESKLKPVSDKINLVATLAPNERVEIQNVISGVVTVIHFKEGEKVEAGDLIFELDTQKLRARVAEAEGTFELAEINRERYIKLFESNTVSQQEFDQAMSRYSVLSATLALRRRQLDDSILRAPFSGVVGYRRVSPGQFIQQGETITTLVDTNPIKADFQVPERFLGDLRINQEININVPAYPMEKFSGNVYFIAPEVAQETRTVFVRATIDNISERLKPGMFGNLELVLQVKEKALVIPESALITQGNKIQVMVVGSDNTVQVNYVTTGLRLDGEVEITDGLNIGERVITEGHQKVESGSKVNPLSVEAGRPSLSAYIDG